MCTYTHICTYMEDRIRIRINFEFKLKFEIEFKKSPWRPQAKKNNFHL